MLRRQTLVVSCMCLEQHMLCLKHYEILKYLNAHSASTLVVLPGAAPKQQEVLTHRCSNSSLGQASNNHIMTADQMQVIVRRSEAKMIVIIVIIVRSTNDNTWHRGGLPSSLQF